MSAVGRLAPTPSGDLHLGNICAFAAAYLSVRQSGGRLIYRNEDVDRERSRPHIAARQQEDLRWLGFDWDQEVSPQSLRDYSPWLKRIGQDCYYCTCTRKVIHQNKGVHPKDCRKRAHDEGAIRFALPDRDVRFIDRKFGEKASVLSTFDDPVLRRRDGMWSYNMAVVADDIADGVTEVVRGADLLDHTAL
ncbi:MAG: tRNA glutamyl-Q(34) synthetase GluQRS, partial [Proteobacteria bacterium]|nr:tRNA glutamyl-Q(34) synthetase GluQRS [Pseudomonadota bacterium]